MLLESLSGTLVHLYALQATLEADGDVDVVDSTEFAQTIAQAFVVGLRSELAQPKPGRVELKSVGLLEWNGETVSLQPEEQLREHLNKRYATLLVECVNSWHELSGDAPFFDASELTSSSVWNDLTLAEALKPTGSATPYPGHEFIAAVFSLLTRARMLKDPDLRLTLKHVTKNQAEISVALSRTTDLLCFLLHDVICSGRGIRLETIGTFLSLPRIEFVADNELISLAQEWRRKQRNNSSDRYSSTSLK